MKNSKVMLPLMAFVFAILMSFTTVKAEGEQGNDYILQNGNWKPINEVNCGSGAEICQVQFGEDGPIYEVYDEMDTETRKDSPTDDPILIPR